MAIVQIRHDIPGRAYFRRRIAAGKTPMEALRVLERRLSDVVYRQLVADAKKASPGGHTGATTTSSAADPTPTVGTSDQSLPGLSTEPTLPHHNTTTGAGDQPARTAAPAPAQPSRRNSPHTGRTGPARATSRRSKL